MEKFVIGITGASGSIYGLRLIEELLRAGKSVSLLLSDAGRQVLGYETGLQLAAEPQDCLQQLRKYFSAGEELNHYGISDFFAPVASGSSAPDAVVICPCSMGTAGRIAAGLSDNLLERVADVALKEQRKLLVVPRETPFNQIHLENLLRLSQAGAQILPAMPAFYQKPQSVEDLVDFVVGKVLDSLAVEHKLFQRWG
ncbi:4-hydroxy-3-polyprenylbenzoate decarboxylase [Malonomonas rubra DSM 5091]|uniref:Flavin prenyltransferase UbiX n=1 Tax=Malonomonas rubra DSM 5091 TaxID=1122189 RepID=A0A1M6HKJ3_MALRU|nr:flavin prenyltransferase UbiX [Malonomonas rubra]SHJ22679.1 4-hydroxy-3-polyprenylbenzoate decarboxylase [Malonomonas rubra DSM 5091]